MAQNSLPGDGLLSLSEAAKYLPFEIGVIPEDLDLRLSYEGWLECFRIKREMPDAEAEEQAQVVWDFYRAFRMYGEAQQAIRNARTDLGMEIEDSEAEFDLFTGLLKGHARFILDKHNFTTGGLQKRLSEPAISVMEGYLAYEIATGSVAEGPIRIVPRLFSDHPQRSETIGKHEDTDLVRLRREIREAAERRRGTIYQGASQGIHPIWFVSSPDKA